MSWRYTARWAALALWVLLGVWGLPVAIAAPGVVMVTTLDLPRDSLAGQAMQLDEPRADASGGAWTLAQAQAAFEAGQGRRSREAVLNLGFGHAPVWLLLHVMNPGSAPVPLNVVVGQSWLDEIDLHVVAADGTARHWRSGDAMAAAPFRDDALGFVFPVEFAPGQNRILLRAATPESLLLSLRLMDESAAARLRAEDQLAYGLAAGFLLALVGYNLLLYPALRRDTQLWYAAYLLSFLVLNLGYTGRGAAWLWGDFPQIQRYAMDLAATLFASSGLIFAERFLELAQYARRLARWVHGAALLGPLLLLGPMLADAPQLAVLVAMGVLWLHLLVMLALGLYALFARRLAAGYFTLAMGCGVVSVGATQVVVHGWVPFSEASFRILEIGMALCATLLALALAQFVRHQTSERLDAERRARCDPLTGLANRRGFLEQAEGPLQLARRHQRPLSVLMVDIDDFKRVNDRYGHAIGDKVLEEMGRFLTWAARRADVLARWGGEEFVLLLPETRGEEAFSLAERVRATIQELSISCGEVDVRITVSLGVAQVAEDGDLDRALAAADAALYRAKGRGRNQVVAAGEKARHLAGQS